MARSKPVAFILDVGVFMSIKTAFDDYVKVAEENVKKLDQTLKEGEDRLEKMKDEMEDKVQQIHKQIIELQVQIGDIKRQNRQNSDGPQMSTAGLESRINQLKEEKDLAFENHQSLCELYRVIHNRMDDFSVYKKKEFEDMLHDGFEEVKSKLQTLESLVDDYSNTKLTL